MRELSLHLLDLIENSVSASASVISVTVEVNRRENHLRLFTADNGRGFAVSPEQASDPFYTTKSGKRTGLGLSLLKAAAERAGGFLRIGKAHLGGAEVEAVMEFAHIDRAPMGDLAGALAVMVCTHPEIAFELKFRLDGYETAIRSRDVAQSLAGKAASAVGLAERIAETIRRDFPDVDRLAADAPLIRKESGRDQ